MNMYSIFMIADQTGIFSEPRLYAISNNKELVQEFKETRNMNFFRIKKDEMTKSEYKKYADKYKAYVLGMRGYITHSDISRTKSKIVSIVSTSYEEETVYIKSGHTQSELAKHTLEDSDIFNDEIIEALKYFMYFDFYMTSSSDEFDYYSGYQISINDSFKDWNVDMLELFIMFYGNTLSSK